MDYETIIWAVFLVWAVWNAVGILAPLFLTTVPPTVRAKAVVSMLAASAKGTVLLPIELLAPIVVPVALAFTKREDDALPRLFQWWDNDVSINGDLREPDGSLTPIPVEDDPAINERNYWAKGRSPRSFWSRFVWLGLRNRASALAADLGVPMRADAQREVWGDPETSSRHEGWVLYGSDGAYQLYIQKRAFGAQFRYNWGFKLWAAAGGREYAPVVNTTISFKRRKT